MKMTGENLRSYEYVKSREKIFEGYRSPRVGCLWFGALQVPIHYIQPADSVTRPRCVIIIYS